MVYIYTLIFIYLGVSIAEALRHLIRNCSQDAPTLQLFIAIIWGIVWPFRLKNPLKTNGA